MRNRGALKTILVFVCLVTSSVAQRKRYDNYHVYELTATSEDQLVSLDMLEADRENYVFLSNTQRVGGKVNVVVAPEAVQRFLRLLQEARISFKLLDTNAQAQLEADEVANTNRGTEEYNWTYYHELNDTYTWMQSLAEKHSNYVSVINVGRSYEGRPIMGVKISYGPDKPSIFIEAGMHAREWIAPATATYIINQLLTNNAKEVRSIAESFDWLIVPHCNPDGYVYSVTTDRLWRKTRTYYGRCYGADPNRNWNFHWNEIGASSNICSDTYAGPRPFSEVETATLSQYLSTLQGKLLLYISLHSYSQLLLFPYGHTPELPKNYKDLKRVFDAAVVGLKRRFGTKYTGGNVYDAIYPASGSSVDWVYGVNGVNYAFTYELRPSSVSFWTGFRLPASQIIPTGEETFDSIMDMARAAGNISS